MSKLLSRNLNSTDMPVDDPVACSAGLIYITRVVKGPKSGMAGGLLQTFIQLGYCVGPSFGTLVLRKAVATLSATTNKSAIANQSLVFTGYAAQDHARTRYASGLSYDAEAFPPASYLHGLKLSAWALSALCLSGQFNLDRHRSMYGGSIG